MNTTFLKRKSKTDGLDPKNNKKKKGFKMWSAFSILMLIVATLVFLSWILHWAGITTTISVPVLDKFDNPTYDEFGKQIFEDKTQIIQALGIFNIFVAPMQGFMEKSSIIVFIMVLGAFIYILVASKALEGFSQMIVAKMKGKEIWAIVPLMIFFSICGTTEGMAEESLGFYMIVIPLMIAAGFDTFTGLMIVLIGAGAGVMASTVNPFVITNAVNGLGEANGEIMSVGDGLVWRLVSWFIITTIAIVFVMLYAKKVKATPSRSVTFATAEDDKEYFLANAAESIEMNWRRKTTLIIFAITFILMIIYLIGWDSILGNKGMENAAESINNHFPYLAFGIPGWGNGGLEIVAGMFLIAAIVVSMINWVGVKKEPSTTGEDIFLKDFMAGVCDIISVCLVIATAAGVGIVLKASFMQELFVTGLANGVGGINSGIGQVIILFIIFLPLSFLIPSTSGFAAAIFPLLTGVVTTSDGAWDPVTASGSITAFSFASGLLNLITPTSGVVMGAMAISRVDYGKYLKAIAPLIGILAATSIALLAIGGVIA